MAVTGTYVEMAVADRITSRQVQLAFTGNYTNQAGGGEILDLKNVTYAASLFDGMKQWSGRRPLLAYPLSTSGAFSIELIPVANQPTQFIVKIFAPGGAEVANAAAYAAQAGSMSGGHNLSNPDTPFVIGFDIVTGT